MIEFFEGDMIGFDNLTRAVAQNALHALNEIHNLSIYHGDIYESRCNLMRNVMVSKRGEVKWIDFEHSFIDAKGEERKREHALATCLWGPCGHVWRE
jgi:RIO-like serine/threonine protein kinase